MAKKQVRVANNVSSDLDANSNNKETIMRKKANPVPGFRPYVPEDRYTVGRSEGYKVGCEKGYENGHRDGYNEGYLEGHSAGYGDCEFIGTEFGFGEAYDAGYLRGRKVGRIEGVVHCYEKGCSEEKDPDGSRILDRLKYLKLLESFMNDKN